MKIDYLWEPGDVITVSLKNGEPSFSFDFGKSDQTSKKVVVNGPKHGQLIRFAKPNEIGVLWPWWHAVFIDVTAPGTSSRIIGYLADYPQMARRYEFTPIEDGDTICLP